MIEQYEFGKIVIDGKEYTHDVLVFPDKILKWVRGESHKVFLEDIKKVVEFKPEILVIGNGHDGVMEVMDDVVEYCKKNNVKLIVEKTGKALEIFNKSEGKVVGALHLTC